MSAYTPWAYRYADIFCRVQWISDPLHLKCDVRKSYSCTILATHFKHPLKLVSSWTSCFSRLTTLLQSRTRRSKTILGESNLSIKQYQQDFKCKRKDKTFHLGHLFLSRRVISPMEMRAQKQEENDGLDAQLSWQDR